jgi:oligopeptide/dipeptide ABC transporter ATP-binding protein
MKTLLEIDNLHVHFYLFHGISKVLNGVNLKIHREGIQGIVGESGCGKSMTALSILQLIKPPGRIITGSIKFRGTDLLKRDSVAIKKIRGRDIALIPQGSRAALNPVFTIGEQISRLYKVHKGMNNRESHEAAELALRSVGIPDSKKRLRAYPHELSGGMCQRVLIAMGLASDPVLLIADEPTTGLDVTIQSQILDLILNLVSEKKSSCILITHALGVIAEVCRHVAVMYAGQVVEYGETVDIFNDPKHPYTEKLIDATLRTDKRKPIVSIKGTVPNFMYLPEGCSFSPRCHRAFDLCHRQKPDTCYFSDNRYVMCHLMSTT